MILEAALSFVQFYKTMGIYITTNMIQWEPTINDSKQEWEILIKTNIENVLDVPKISKAFLIIKWTEYFDNFLHRTVGEIKILLYYFIRKFDTVPG